MGTRVRVCAYVYIYIFVCIYTYVYVHRYIFIHLYVHLRLNESFLGFLLALRREVFQRFVGGCRSRGEALGL